MATPLLYWTEQLLLLTAVDTAIQAIDKERVLPSLCRSLKKSTGPDGLSANPKVLKTENATDLSV